MIIALASPRVASSLESAREQGKAAGASLVEIDLVLQGRPTLEFSRDGLPDWDYAVTVSPARMPDRYEIYSGPLQRRLPRFRLPLAVDDRGMVLDLQSVFEQAYDQGGYSGRIDYGREPVVPLGEENRRWLGATLTRQGLRRPLPPHEEIARAAYHLWEQEGRPHGRHEEHWHKAVAQLRRPGHEGGAPQDNTPNDRAGQGAAADRPRD
jgi:Protein of unknown function (DUF4058)/Protein of unknown function (DUF2934)